MAGAGKCCCERSGSRRGLLAGSSLVLVAMLATGALAGPVTDNETSDQAQSQPVSFLWFGPLTDRTLSPVPLPDFDLASVRAGRTEVPPVFAERLPTQLEPSLPTKVKKALFLKTMLPLILRHNETVLADREKLKVLANAPERVANEHKAWLASLAKRYGSSPQDLTELISRVDVVPPSLALAQAIVESGWGGSRFAREGNAVYGQRSWRPGSGLVPASRDPGAKHEVAVFRSLAAAVAAYVQNLNTHPAYADLRRVRAERRAGGLALDGASLAEHLTAYSEQREAYTEKLQTVIRVNRLSAFDAARLAGSEPPGSPI